MEIRAKRSSGEEITMPVGLVEALRHDLRGELITAGDEGYEAARRVWNGTIDRRPALIARCRGIADVVACVHLARDEGLLLAVRGGGHNVAGNAVCDGGLVIDLSPMRSVHVDQASSCARIEGGAVLGDVDAGTQVVGMATPSGVVSATGYAGLTLHGGMGWQTRKHGLACDNVLSVEVVTAGGRVVTASAREHPDLYWALRGGGGSFGVATSFVSKLHPIPRELRFSVAVFPLEHARRVMRFVREYVADTPDELSVLTSLWSVPELPEIPTALHGGHALYVLACYIGPPEEGQRVVRPLQECAPRLAQLGGALPWLEVQRFLDADYPDGRRYYWKSTFARQLDDALVDLLLEDTVARPSPLSSIDVWFLGGAFLRTRPDETAFAWREPGVVVSYESNWIEPQEDERNISWTRRALGRVRELTTSRTYLNFAGYGEEGETLVRDSYGDNYARLQQVKSRYDPDNLFRSNFNIAPGL